MGEDPVGAARPTATALGFPRLGRDRELKFALEAHWRGEIDEAELGRRATAVRRQAIDAAVAAGLDAIPSGDQALYDHVLDTTLMLGAIPERFRGLEDSSLQLEFAFARGTDALAPLEMTKWLDTNYHYLVPEIGPRQAFLLDPTRQLERLDEVTSAEAAARPVVLGPYSYLRLAKPSEPGFDPLRHLDALLPLYEELIDLLEQAGARSLQIDEPCLVLEPSEEDRAAAERALRRLAATDADLTLATYFAGVERELPWLARLPLHRLHLDLVRAPGQLEVALAQDGALEGLSLGLVDGRNIWRADLDAALAQARRAAETLGPERITVASSCSLLHVPYSAAREDHLDPTVHGWLAFADEKLDELARLRDALADPAAADELLASSREVARQRRSSRLAHDPAVAKRLAGEGPAADRTPFGERYPRQLARLALPELPTTTVGSFPQTQELRDARRRLREGELEPAAYEEIVRQSVRDTIARQEELGLDVLVHGEAERNDMVEYFAEHLDGFAVTRHGWVQSYGSRGVKPAIIYGDVSRPEPITVRWWKVAQEATARPVKGMLTGPITILQWTFPRDDVPRETIARQIALAVRDEVLDLERAGARVIQVDEPGLREGLPLRASERAAYLGWAVEAFRLATLAVGDATQVQTHMCYADFDDIVEDVARMDADVILMEASRSGMGPLDAFAESYGNAVGPGVYDIHSPRIPSVEEMEDLLADAERRLGRGRVWVTPDCGLKTRRWEEVVPALTNLVSAARRRRVAEGDPVT